MHRTCNVWAVCFWLHSCIRSWKEVQPSSHNYVAQLCSWEFDWGYAARLAAEALALTLFFWYDEQLFVTSEDTSTLTTPSAADTTTGSPVAIKVMATTQSREAHSIVAAALRTQAGIVAALLSTLGARQQTAAFEMQQVTSPEIPDSQVTHASGLAVCS